MGEPQVAHATTGDGTEIGYVTSGDGPPLLLVHGGGADHTRLAALRPHLETHGAVHAMDRRGRGLRSDEPEYSVDREHEDVSPEVFAQLLLGFIRETA